MNNEDIQGDKIDSLKNEYYVPYSIFESDTIPEGYSSIFLSTPTVEIFNLKNDSKPEKGTARFYLLTRDSLLSDILKRAAVSDFSPFKEKIKQYTDNQILLIEDFDYKFGENFIICLDKFIKNATLTETKKFLDGEEEGENESEEDNDFDDLMNALSPRTDISSGNKPWISLGSEKEVDQACWKYSRTKFARLCVRKMELVSQKLELSKNNKKAKHFYASMPETETKLKLIEKTEIDKYISCVPETKDIALNTKWPFPTNKITQYIVPEYTQAQKEMFLSEMNLENLEQVITYGLNANNFYKNFVNDYKNLTPKDDLFEVIHDGSLKSIAVFSSLRSNKNKAITCIRNHPKEKNTFGISLSEKLSFDERVEQQERLLGVSNFIVVWNLNDPMTPQLLLSAKDDIYSFAFNPSNPGIVAGGLVNGQVILWDITEYQDLFETVVARLKTEQEPEVFAFEEFRKKGVPQSAYSALSNIDASHQSPIMDIQWVPDHIDIAKSGLVSRNRECVSMQFMSAGLDGKILLWDIREDRCPFVVEKNRDRIALPAGAPKTFALLHEKMKPLLKINPIRPDADLPIFCTKFSMMELQSMRNFPRSPAGSIKDEESPKNISPAFKATPLQNISTYLFVGSEDGEVFYIDWMPIKDQEMGRIITPKPEFVSMCHMGSIVFCSRCPHWSELNLVVGGFTWTLWKDKVHAPILSSPISNKRYTNACWCPEKPSCFFITRVDGTVEIWDLMSKTQEPVAVESLITTALTAICCWVDDRRLLLCLGDANGVSYMYRIPDLLLSNQIQADVANFKNYIGRELKRLEYYQTRFSNRESDRIEMENELKKRAGMTSIGDVVGEEFASRQKAEYEAFLDELSRFKKMLDLDVENELDRDI